MSALVIIPCGAAKRDYACQAHEMYVGTYFKACLRWALSATTPDRVLILSAKYGLLPLQQQIEPYDVTFGRDSSVTVDEVRRQATAMGLRAETKVLVAAGKRYVAMVQAVWPTARNVLDGKGGMGHQISWLTKEATK